MQTVVEGRSAKVVISWQSATAIVGERINPTGRKKIGEALEKGHFEALVQEAVLQAEAGAHVIDVNVGLAGIYEEEVLPRVVSMVADAVDIPICIDSSKPDALRSALEVCPGRPLLNSTTGEEKSLEAVLPLASQYKVPVIGLTMDEKGIPKESETRFLIAKKIIERAEDFGIERRDVLIDVIAMPIGADQQSGRVSFETARRVSEELGVNIILGASNVSHGLPARDIINAAFFAMGAMCGVSAYIMDPTKTHLFQSILAADLLLGKDEWATNYLTAYRKMGVRP